MTQDEEGQGPVESSTTDHATPLQAEKSTTGSVDLSRETTEHDDPDEIDYVESRAIQRKYFFNRPRALQFTYLGNVVNVTEEAEANHAANLSREGSGNSSSRFNHVEVRGIEKSRERMDLFIDLIWVGVISNLTEVFSSLYFNPESQRGLATLVFVFTYLPSWRIWNVLRSFMNDYYMDDMLQRVFLLWILVLSVFYGNNLAYLTDDINDLKKICVVLYLTIRGSFLVMESIYSVFIPWLRKLVILGVVLMLPVTGLWVATIYIDGIKAAIPVGIALLYEYAVPFMLESHSFINKFTPQEYHKEIDRAHLTSRFGSFFIITVGEGVLQLISRGPLGYGISDTAGTAVWAFLIYFNLAFAYFNRCSSKTIVPAVRRERWRTLMWISVHIPLFTCFITLSAGVMFLLRAIPLNAYNYDTQHQKEEIPEQRSNTYRMSAIWAVGCSLAIILGSMTGLALLDKPLDPPGTLLVNNRYVRLSVRIVVIVVVLCVPISDNIPTPYYLLICGIACSLISAWEYVTSLEKGGGLVEPKGLTAIMRSEKKLRHRRGHSGVQHDDRFRHRFLGSHHKS